jgi:uncharacterized membrane protein YphA (DoxX/SURF4 family)
VSPGPAPSWLLRFDHAAIEFTRRHGLRILRVALGLVFLWFGALKLLDVSPVADLVAQTVYWLPAELVVRGLGGLEIVIGLGLLTGWAIRATLALFFGQMLGTFLVFVVHPDRTFQGGNPLKLTVLGEFVVKNLVLIAAGIAIGSTIPKARRAPLPAMLKEKATP